MRDVIERGDTLYWKSDGIEVSIIDIYIDKDGETQVRVQDGDNLLTLTASDIAERLENDVLVRERADTLMA